MKYINAIRTILICLMSFSFMTTACESKKGNDNKLHLKVHTKWFKEGVDNNVSGDSVPVKILDVDYYGFKDDIAIKKSQKDFLSKVNEQIEYRFRNSEDVLWDLEWPGVATDHFSFYVGGLRKDSNTSDYHNYEIDESGKIVKYDIYNLIQLVKGGHKEAWKVLEQITFDIVKKTYDLTPLRVVAFKPNANVVIVVFEENVVRMPYLLFRNYIPFANILLEGYIREATDGNVSINTLNNDSDAIKWLSKKYHDIHDNYESWEMK